VNSRLVAICEYPIKNEIKELEFKQKSKTFVVGPITYYYAGGKLKYLNKAWQYSA